MATLVKFLIDKETKEVFAYFPNINFNEQLYGTSQKRSFNLLDGFEACPLSYALECQSAIEYKTTLAALIACGYDDLIIENEIQLTKHYENSYNEMYTKLQKENPDFDVFTEKLDKWVATNAPKYGINLNSNDYRG